MFNSIAKHQFLTLILLSMFVTACDNDSINLPPVANTVGISGVTALGSTITGLYTYVDSENDVQGVSIFKWLRDDVAIPGANTLSYIITQQDQGKTLKFEVTPVAKTGTLIGIAVQSEYVIVDKALGVNIVANPVSGTSPLTVRFGVNVVNNNVVFKSYDWDFTSDDTYDISDTFGAPKTYIYTGPPGTKFIATLKVSPQGQESIIATKTITITDTPSSIQASSASSNVTNRHVPLTTTLTVTAQDPQGIAQ
ncbi:MAG: hypothetical protein FE834_05645, partial [Gammaproteobacteria bacterium]|nr:hypothetical protein [Gammaproteobacteria bacterium]